MVKPECVFWFGGGKTLHLSGRTCAFGRLVKKVQCIKILCFKPHLKLKYIIIIKNNTCTVESTLLRIVLDKHSFIIIAGVSDYDYGYIPVIKI